MGWVVGECDELSRRRITHQTASSAGNSVAERGQRAPGGVEWGDENLKVGGCRIVALWATVATRRGVWGGACVSEARWRASAPHPRWRKHGNSWSTRSWKWGALQRKQIHLHTRPPNSPREPGSTCLQDSGHKGPPRTPGGKVRIAISFRTAPGRSLDAPQRGLYDQRPELLPPTDTNGIFMMESVSFDVLPLLFAAGEPTVDAHYVTALVSRVFHILGAIILGGGIFYLRTILAPAGEDACFANRRHVWARWVGAATFLLLASGIYNLINIIGEAKAAGEKLPGTYHMLFGIKFLIGVGVMFLAAIMAGKTAAAEKFRANLSRWLNVAWAGVLAIVVIAAVLRTYH